MLLSDWLKRKKNLVFFHFVQTVMCSHVTVVCTFAFETKEFFSRSDGVCTFLFPFPFYFLFSSNIRNVLFLNSTFLLGYVNTK